VPRPVVFVSDFGLADAFVGVCHGVIARIAPDCHVIDLTHEVAPQDVRRGALVLAQALAYMPDDAVYLAVVDPGVGGARRPVVVEAGSGTLLVGPDNGLLSLAWDALGGALRARVIDGDGVILRAASATFHGRDVFAPVAAHLALGLHPDQVGRPAEPSSLMRTAAPVADATSSSPPPSAIWGPPASWMTRGWRSGHPATTDPSSSGRERSPA
jgi:S-adenosyl-L-methionine hydrolase (adenosine-forming)